MVQRKSSFNQHIKYLQHSSVVLILASSTFFAQAAEMGTTVVTDPETNAAAAALGLPADQMTDLPPPPTPPSQQLQNAAKNLQAVEANIKEGVGFGNLPANGALGLLETAAPQAANPNVASILPEENMPITTMTSTVPASGFSNSVPTANAPSTFGTPQDPAFQNMIKKMYPMSPEQINALRESDLQTQRAISGSASVGVPTPTLSSQTVSLSPGSTPPVIRLSTGYVSSVVFVDETGAPWPIGAYSIGDPTSFNIQWDTKSNLLLIQGQRPYASGNMAVRLQDMATPVMLTLVTDQNNVDYRIDFRVQGRGPQAQASMIGAALPQNTDAILMNLLDGIPPQDSQTLQIIGGPAQGWLHGNTLYLRTSLTILSPAWIKTMTSADGTRVYQFNATPMVLASQGGQPLTLKIEGL